MLELNLIKKIEKLVKTDSSVVRGIGDDAAVLKYTKDKYLLWTADMLVEGVDFTRKASFWDIGHKAIACSLSDIAAMGGVAKYALVSLGLPKKIASGFIDKFYQGALKLGRAFGLNIVGGDLSASDKIVIDVSMIGEVEKKRLVLRSGAKAGDSIFVTGALGGSIYGRHLRFTPRLKEARYLTQNYKINSMLDISDGLSIDLHRLSKASSVGALIYRESIPVSKEARSFDEALNMGEDFELLFTASEKEAARILKDKSNFAFACIGEVLSKSQGLKIADKYGKVKSLISRGYQHF